MKIYTSQYEPASFPDESVWTHLFRTHFGDFPPDRRAFIDAETERAVTRQEAKDLTLSLAHGLLNEFPKLGGVQLHRGDVVMVFSPNTLAFPITLLGGLAAGLRMTLANSAYTPREVEHQWSDSRAKAMVVHPSLIPVALETFKLLDVGLTDAKRRIIVADWAIDPPPASARDYICLSDLLGKGKLAEEAKFPGEQSNETALICYSSGTTGKPKGVETTHRNLVSIMAIVQGGYPLSDLPDQAVLGVLPFYHIYGAVNLLLGSFFRGPTTVIMQRFDPVKFCKWVEKYQITESLVVPPICLVLAHHPATGQYNMKSLKILFSGAAPLGGPLVNALRKRLLSHGVDAMITQGYGLTETSPTTHILPLADSLRKVGSAGKLCPSIEARLVVEDVEDAKEGEPGELWVRGPNIMKGYLYNEEATKNAITPDGWFKTGDVAICDPEGFYYIVDRRKELIKYKGFQVPPAELESVLLQHPQIVDVAVIGIHSEEQATELPRAYVVSKKALSSGESQAFTKEVQEWIKPRVAKHKFLRGGVVVIDIIPKSPAGKILRRELRERAKKELLAETAPKPKL